MVEAPVMAKKKAAPKGAKVPKMTTRAFRMTEEYAEWLERVAGADKRTVSSFLDAAVAHYAEVVGVTEKPPVRVP